MTISVVISHTSGAVPAIVEVFDGEKLETSISLLPGHARTVMLWQGRTFAVRELRFVELQPDPV